MWQKLSTSSVALVLAALPFAASAQDIPQPAIAPPWSPTPAPWHMWAGEYGWHWWWAMPLMMLGMIVVCALVMQFVFGCGRSHGHGRSGPDDHPEPPRYRS